MKTLRNTLIFCLIVVALFCAAMALSGCESFSAGVATGAGVTHTLEGVQRDLDARQAGLVAERTAILDQIAAANSDAEKLVLTAQVDALQKQIDTLIAADAAVELTQTAAATDWKDPNQVAPWVSSAAAALVWFLAGKKKRQD